MTAASFYATYASGRVCVEAPGIVSLATANVEDCLKNCGAVYDAPFYFQVDAQAASCYCVGYTCTLQQEGGATRRVLSSSATGSYTVYKSFPRAGGGAFSGLCGAGYRRSYTNDSCACCPANTYWPNANEDTYECLTCPGSFVSGPCSAVADACHSPCKKNGGRYWSVKEYKCKKCPAGTYWPDDGTPAGISCLPCREGATSTKGATVCKGGVAVTAQTRPIRAWSIPRRRRVR